MKPITECKQHEQDYRQKMSACNVSYRLKRSGPMVVSLLSSSIFYVHTYPCVDNYILSYHPPGQLTELPAYSELLENCAST